MPASHPSLQLLDDEIGERDDMRDIAVSLKALGHPVRLQILRRLCCDESCCCADLCERVPLAQSTVSQHLKMLCEAGLVRLRQVGTRSHYSLVPERLDEVVAALAEIRCTETER